MKVDLRLAVPAAAGWIAAVVLVGLPQFALWVGVGFWVLAALLWRTRLALSLVVVGLLASVIAVHAAARQPAALVEAAGSGRYVEQQFTATEAPVGDRVTGTLDGGVPVLLFGEVGELRIGGSASVGGTVKAADAGEDVAFLFFASSVERNGDPPWFLGWADGLRDSFADAASELPGDGARLLPGLAIGDTRAVSPGLDAAMKASSLSRGAMPRRRRMSMAVTMRPRRFSDPATSGGARGTTLIAVGVMTSWTCSTGAPKLWSPTRTETTP